MEGPASVKLPFEVRGGFPIMVVGLRGARTSRPARQEVVIDTGGKDVHFGIHEECAGEVGVWIWPESRGKVRVWSLNQGLQSLGALYSLEIDEVLVRGVPVAVKGGDRRRVLPTLGMRLLAMFDVLVLDWKNNQVGLHRHSQCQVPASPDKVWVKFRWWDMIEAPADRRSGFLVVEADVSDQPVEVIIDTGSNFDLVIPRSATNREPWTSVLQEQRPIMLHTSTGAHLSRRYTLRGTFSLGGCVFHGLRVVDVDDSTLPAGMRLLPIIGTPLLRRFDSVTLDFVRRAVGFESCGPSTKTFR